MALIIEDGSGVDNANSYDTIDNMKAYATARGLTLTGTATVIEQRVAVVMDYLESLRNRYKGVKTVSTYALQWPREGVLIDGVAIANNIIPTELKQAEAQLVYEVQEGATLTPNSEGPFITREKIDELETEYSEKIKTGSVERLGKVESLLAVLLNTFFGPTTTVRI